MTRCAAAKARGLWIFGTYFKAAGSHSVIAGTKVTRISTTNAAK
jgi:hypothetical protein